MGDEAPRREPSTWEVMRGIERVEKRLDGFARDFVSVIVHNLLVERVKELEGDIAEARADAKREISAAKKDAADEITSIRTELDNAKKTRAQTWTAIGLLAAGGAITLFYTVIRQGLGLP